MSTLNVNYPTLLDLAQQPENKDAADVINLLVQFNPMLEDALALPCNMGLKHKTTIVTGLPDVAFGRLYKGIQKSKGSKQVIEDATGFVESASVVDRRLVDIVEGAEDKASIRMSEAELHIEAMSQEVATTLFYGDSSIEPEKPTGFSARFNDLSAENGKQIIDAGGVGADNASIWMITWDKSASHLLYPKNHQIGLKRFVPEGTQYETDGSGNKYSVYREEFTWHYGLTVRNWQYVARIANIDISDLTIDAASGANLVNLMTEMYYAHKGRRLSMGKTMIYMNTNLVKFLDYQARLQTGINLFLTFKEMGVNAKEVLHFRGVPIRESDALLDSEVQVS